MGWILAIILAVLIIGFLTAAFYFAGPMVGATTVTYPYYPHPLVGFFFFPFGIILFFLLFAFIVRLAFWPWRRGYYGHHGRWRSWDDANEILRQRYARGEITKDQFEQMQRDLGQHK
jgi:putative membrane protein